jgi:autotransporter-associated beta strand protein
MPSRRSRLVLPVSPRRIRSMVPATTGLMKAMSVITLALAVEHGISREAAAQTTYYTTTGSTQAWNASRWGTNSAGPFTSTYTALSPVAFTSGSYQFAGMGATVNVGNVTLSSNVNVFFNSAANTYATNGVTQTVDVGSGGVYDLNSQSISTAAGTGFLKTGAGVFATAGNTYAGGFTLNAGTVIARGVNAMGSGGALTLNGGVVASNNIRDLSGKYTSGITVGGNVQFGEFASNVALANDTANLTFSNNMALGASNRTLTLGNKGTVTFGGVIQNTSGDITFAAAPGAEATVASAGRFDVTNLANTFTGNLTFTGAEVRFSGDGSLGNAANDIIIDGGRFAIASGSNVALGASRDIQVGDGPGTSINVPGASGTLTYNNPITNVTGEVGSWTKQGGSVLRLGGVSTYTGSTTIANGTMQFTTGNDRLPTTTVLSLGQAASTNRGTLDLGGFNQTIAGLSTIIGSSGITNLVTTSVGSGTLSINVTSGSSFTYGDGSATNSGVISGAVSIVKQGAGTQILGGSNSYTGPTTLSAGTLRSGTGTVGNFAFGSGTLALNGGTLTSGTDNAARTFTNNISVGGDVAFGDATATGGLAFSGTVNLGNATRTLTTVQTTTFSGPISNGGLIKSGAALLTLSSSNAYSAGTTVSAGTLRAGNANSFGSGSVTLSASSTLDLNALAIANAITNNGGTLANAASYTGTQSLTAAASFGALGGTLSVINGGTATLTGAMTGTVSVAAGGQVNLNDGASLSQSTLANDGIVAVNQSGTTTLSTAITGVGAFQKLGSGILTVSGNNTYSGATTVSAGGLKVNGSIGGGGLSVAAAAWLMGTGTINGPVTVSGTLSPGSGPGVITLGSLTLTDTSTTVIDIASAGTRGSAYDGVSILDPSGLTYGGTVSFAFGGSAIADNTTFDIFDFTGSSAGSLAAIESTGFYAGTWTPLGSGTFQLVSGTQTLTFSQATGEVIVVPEPAAIAVAAVGLGTIGLALLRRRRA